MKISVICKGTEWQVEKLKESATSLGVDIEIRDIAESETMPPEALGDVVLWRSSSLGSGAKRFSMMSAILKKHLLINKCLVHLPRSTEKAFQQEYAQMLTKAVKCIPTFTFRSVQEIEGAIQNGTLRYPFIQKPNRGSKGKGVELVQNKEDLNRVAKEIELQVYQNFISNSGDYRAFILGGRMLGAIKRTPETGGFLNNISQGGKAEAVTDLKILMKLRQIGTTIASIFELTLCGVDIIFDETLQEYFFLEVNTVPQWKGFQEATGIDVAKEIIQYCKRMVGREHRPTLDLVFEEYQSQLHLLGDKKFHFLSRLYLWSGDKSFKDRLDEVEETYIGNSEESYRKRLAEIFTHTAVHGDRMAAGKAREEYYKKYPLLEASLGLLFKNLFAREIYGVDLRTYIRELVSDADLLHLKSALENDEGAMRILSTHAINYLYMLDAYLGTEEAKTHPEKYFRIGASYEDESFTLQMYFFTHCVIGASKFYTAKVKKDELATYVKMLKFVEKLIQEHFETISLDNKLEFLVCAKICGFVSRIEKRILSEGAHSLAPDGNFIIDTHNTKASLDAINDFLGAEHRNVLYIMSQMPFRLHRN